MHKKMLEFFQDMLSDLESLAIRRIKELENEGVAEDGYCRTRLGIDVDRIAGQLTSMEPLLKRDICNAIIASRGHDPEILSIAKEVAAATDTEQPYAKVGTPLYLFIDINPNNHNYKVGEVIFRNVEQHSNYFAIVGKGGRGIGIGNAPPPLSPPYKQFIAYATIPQVERTIMNMRELVSKGRIDTHATLDFFDRVQKELESS